MQDKTIDRVGKRVVMEGLVTGNFGNFALRGEAGFWVKKSGAYLDQPGDLIFVPDSGEVPSGASHEWRVHAEIFRSTHHKAVLHTHPPNVIAASFTRAVITPIDAEGLILCPSIPVVDGPCGSEILGKVVAKALQDGPIAVARGHGTFAAGTTLEEAYLVTSAAEHACRILQILGRLGPGEK
ncbi:MAG: class II aldolase/adducin family protein [Methanomicrobiales archaeon]|nr:class II aldolase/adducin family protein [Methanomicrobiales archaeon]